MSVELEVRLKASADKEGLNGAIDDFKTGFEGLGDSLGKNLSNGIDSFTKGAGKTLTNSLGSSILDGVTGGLDSIEDVWENAWESLGKSAKSALSSALGSLTLGGLGSLFGINLGGSSSGSSLLTSALGLGAKAASGETGSSWLASLFGAGAEGSGGETLASGVSSFMEGGEGLAEALGSLGGGAEELGLIGGQTLGDLGGLGGGLESLGGLGMESAAEGAFGLSAGATAAGAILAPLAVGELASMLGLMEGASPLSAIFGEGGGHSKESAQSTISADMEYLAASAQVLQEALEGANTGASTFATTMVTQMSGASLEMSRLAERAGMSQDEIDAMVEALDPASAKLIEASESVGLVNEKIDSMDNVLEQSVDSFAGANTAASEFQDMLLAMAGSMDLPAESSDTLSTSIKSLVEQWNSGQISADTLSTSLKSTFATALTDLASQTSTTTDQMKALADSIESIPTEWTSNVNVVYNKIGEEPNYQHGGGLLMHGGGRLADPPRYHSGARVTALFADEVPVIAQQGEFIVRRDSVNAATLPLLKALNQGGQANPAPISPINLHMEVHGNLMGDESAFNDLARLLESKLRDLDQARYGA